MFGAQSGYAFSFMVQINFLTPNLSGLQRKSWEDNPKTLICDCQLEKKYMSFHANGHLATTVIIWESLIGGGGGVGIMMVSHMYHLRKPDDHRLRYYKQRRA